MLHLLEIVANEMVIANFVWLILLIVGFCLVVVEMYMPGFGFPGIAGSVCLIAGIALYARTDIVAWLVLTVIIVALLCVALSISIRSAARGRLAKSKLVLNEVSTTSELSENDLSYYVGKNGVTSTILRPAGIGDFAGVKLNVLSDGEFIPAGARVTVTRVEGNRIFVRKDD